MFILGETKGFFMAKFLPQVLVDEKYHHDLMVKLRIDGVTYAALIRKFLDDYMKNRIASGGGDGQD